MLFESPNIATPCYYEGLAEELETIAEAVRSQPHLSHHVAERLNELSQQIRDDARLATLKPILN